MAQLKLQPFLPNEIEYVAIEALEELVEKVRDVQEVEELKRLAASIAHHRAVSPAAAALRQKARRGPDGIARSSCGGRGPPEPAGGRSPLDEVNEAELAQLLGELQRDLKPEHRAVLTDFFLNGLSYEQIASRNGLALGTVGVYLKRGPKAMRKAGERHPKLLKELEEFLR